MHPDCFRRIRNMQNFMIILGGFIVFLSGCKMTNPAELSDTRAYLGKKITLNIKSPTRLAANYDDVKNNSPKTCQLPIGSLEAIWLFEPVFDENFYYVVLGNRLRGCATNRGFIGREGVEFEIEKSLLGIVYRAKDKTKMFLKADEKSTEVCTVEKEGIILSFDQPSVTEGFSEFNLFGHEGCPSGRFYVPTNNLEQEKRTL